AATVALTITGTCTSATHSPTLSLTVALPNDFSISAPASASVTQGSSTPVTVSTALTSGSAQSIALSASGLPSGVRASFSPTAVSAGGSSTLTLTATGSAATGTLTITITRTGT